jgi:hypothetical protein
MKLKVSLVIALLAVALSAVVAVAAPSADAARPTTGSATTTTIHGTNGYVGTFAVTSFQKVGTVIRAYGTFNGTDASGNPITDTGYAEVLTGGAANTAAAAAATGSCQILNLTLGPLHLDLLGLVVDLNQIHLQITAQQGSGNLLGNLLCAVAGLLDNTGTGGGLSGILQSITNLLNQILGQL